MIAQKKLGNSPLPYYGTPFLILVGYVLFLLWRGFDFSADRFYYLIQYVYTYDHGFVSRGLIGEIISWFVDVVTPQVTAYVVLIGDALLIVSSSLCIGSALYRTRTEKDLFRILLVLILILALMPTGYARTLKDDTMEKFLWAITFFAVLCAKSEKLVWLVPPLCLLAATANPVFLFCGFVLIALILLQKLTDSNFSGKMIAICAVSVLAMIGMGIFSAVSERHLGFTDAEEMARYYFRRYSDPGILSEYFLNFLKGKGLIDFFERDLLYILKYVLREDLLGWENLLVVVTNTLFVFVPIYALLTTFWIRCMRLAPTPQQRFVFLCCLLSPLILMIPIILSWETPKYFSINFLVQVCFAIHLAVQRNETVLQVKDQCVQTIQKHKTVSALIFAYLCMFMVNA